MSFEFDKELKPELDRLYRHAFGWGFSCGAAVVTLFFAILTAIVRWQR